MKESQNIEWKESWRDEYLKWICGFANAQGGKIYIGVDDDGNVVGCDDCKKLSEDLPNKILQHLGIAADVNVLDEGDKSYIEICVKPSSYPVNYKGEYHFRSGSTKQRLVGAALTEFLTNKTGIRWEDVVVEDVTVEDLDKESFDIFRREALRSKRMTKSDLKMSNEELLDSLDLISDGKLKRAAIILFHRNPEKWFTGCYTKIGKFGKGSDLQYQDEVKGSLFIQADRVIELIFLKYLKADISYDGMVRVETYPFPKDAVREAYYNALIHSCWSTGVPVQIRIEDDAMYISNDCIFPSDWTVETLYQRHRSRPYNPSIAGAFFRAGYVETWGRGIQKICEACEQYGVAGPEYNVHSEDIMLKINALPIADKSIDIIPKVQNELLDEPLDDLLHDPLAAKLLVILKENPRLTYEEMASTMNVSVSTIKRAMKVLTDKNIISRVNGKRFGYWQIN